MSTLDLQPTEKDIKLMRGDPRTVTFDFEDSDGNDVDISSDDVFFQAWDGYGGTETIAKKTNSSGTHSDGPNGETQFTLTDDDTDDADDTGGSVWVYRVWRDNGGALEDWFYGKLIIRPNPDPAG